MEEDDDIDDEDEEEMMMMAKAKAKAGNKKTPQKVRYIRPIFTVSVLHTVLQKRRQCSSEEMYGA